MLNLSRTKILFATLLISLFFFNACALNLKTIPAPPPSAKLRVYAVAITNKQESKWRYSLSNDEFADLMYQRVGHHLKETGIYDFVPREDINTVVGNQVSHDETHWWYRNDFALPKEIGKKLHADYVFIVSRHWTVNCIYKMTLVNLKTGAQHSTSYLLTVYPNPEYMESISTKALINLYRQIFFEAKGDLLATAVRKGRIMPKEGIKKDGVPESKFARAPLPVGVDLSATDNRRVFEKKLKKEMEDGKPATDKTKLIVYDFNSEDQLNVVSLILSEALREELFMLGKHWLVNRENLQQVMHELNLQQAGLVDEKQIVKLGKWLAANEAVTGRLAAIGNLYILQAKRTDIKTLGTLSIGSLKCAAGQEEELLKGMPGLARKLVGLESDLQ
jgi:hypothetical protein